jgi:hypothetical protein
LGGIAEAGGQFGLDVAGGALSGTLPVMWGTEPSQARASMPSPYVGTAGMIPAIAGIGRSLAARFPQLAFAIQSWRARGINLTMEKLYGLLRRFGPELLVSAGILTAGALTELMFFRATHKRRRMNCLNPKALRRSTRRLLCFERRACKVQMALGTIASGHTTHRRRARTKCFKCHRNPCVCN